MRNAIVAMERGTAGTESNVTPMMIDRQPYRRHYHHAFSQEEAVPHSMIGLIRGRLGD